MSTQQDMERALQDAPAQGRSQSQAQEQRGDQAATSALRIMADGPHYTNFDRAVGYLMSLAYEELEAVEVRLDALEDGQAAKAEAGSVGAAGAGSAAGTAAEGAGRAFTSEGAFGLTQPQLQTALDDTRRWLEENPLRVFDLRALLNDVDMTSNEIMDLAREINLVEERREILARAMRPDWNLEHLAGLGRDLAALLTRSDRK